MRYLRSAPREGWKPCAPNQLRMCILGLPNSGKTEFCCSIPNTLILDLAGHANMVPRIHEGSHIERVTDIVTLMNIVDELVEAKKHKPWSTVVIDDGDILMDWMIQYLSTHPKYNPGLKRADGVLDELWSITDFGQGGKGWYIVRNEIIERTISRLSDAGYGWVITGNMSQKQRQDGDQVEKYLKPVMAGSVIDGIRRAAHYTIHFVMTYSIEEVEEGSRKEKIGGKVMTKRVTRRKPVHRLVAVLRPPDDDDDTPTKARFLEHMPQDEDGNMGFIVERIDPWGSWVKVYEAAVAATAKALGVEMATTGKSKKSRPENGNQSELEDRGE